MKTLQITIIVIFLLSITFVLPSVHGITGSALFMKTNSTAKIYAKFTVHVLSNETLNLTQGMYLPGIYSGMNESPVPIDSKNMTIVAEPSAISGDKNNTSVTYTITAKNNTKGVYALFLYYCGLQPLVVGLNESQVNPGIFTKYFTATYNCPMETASTPVMNIVGSSGIITKVIAVNANNTITVLPQNMSSPNNFYQPPTPPPPVVLNQSLQLLSPPPALYIPIYPSPLQQFKTGTTANKIQCNFGLQLVIKSKDGTPACVTSNTAQKLVERGWAKEIVSNKSNITNSTNETNNISNCIYPCTTIHVAEPNLIKIKSVGISPYPLKVGDIARFNVTYQKTGDGQLYHIIGCGSDLSATFSPSSSTREVYNGRMCAEGTEPIKQNQTITDATWSSYNILKPGLLNVTLNLYLSKQGIAAFGDRPEAKIQFFSNVLQPNATASLENNTGIATLGNNTLPASFEPCQDPYPQNYTGIPVLYMKQNSTGKICVRYHNLNNFPVHVGIGISEADNLTQDAKDVSTWNDSGNNTISARDSTVVYWIKTGNNKGLYGLTIFCVPMPLAVGYDNSTLKQNDFPWLGQNTWFCPMEAYNFHIDSTTGFKVGYIQAK